MVSENKMTLSRFKSLLSSSKTTAEITFHFLIDFYEKSVQLQHQYLIHKMIETSDIKITKTLLYVECKGQGFHYT